MLAPPLARASAIAPSLRLEHWQSPDVEKYRTIYRAVGEDWMWVSRLEMADDKLAAILNDPLVEIYVATENGRAIGLMELDFREPNECELAFFGLVIDAIGKGAGRFLMNHAVEKAWSRPIRRFWVHTCHFDSPAALPFYQRSGFRPYALMVEVHDDPRLSGIVPRTASPHIPMIFAPSGACFALSAPPSLCEGPPGNLQTHKGETGWMSAPPLPFRLENRSK
jgi:GNAT superfamily N-acetyltransferase